MDTHYQVLECSEDATEEEIKRNYKKLALKLHPDKAENCTNQFDLLNKAFTTLVDPQLRHQYDMALMKRRSENRIINEEVSLEDFTLNNDEGCYEYDCRCGGVFVVSRVDLRQPNSIVDCDSCSLSIRVVTD